MCKIQKLSVLFCSLILLQLTAVSHAEEKIDRKTIAMPSAAKVVFLAQMQGHVIGLDGILVALADHDLLKAAAIARESMGVPRGKGDDLSGSISGSEAGPGLGFGKYLPEGMKEIASRFHKVAITFADLAESTTVPPDVVDQTQLIKALSAVTTQCRACHERYAVE